MQPAGKKGRSNSLLKLEDIPLVFPGGLEREETNFKKAQLAFKQEGVDGGKRRFNSTTPVAGQPMRGREFAKKRGVVERLAKNKFSRMGVKNTLQEKGVDLEGSNLSQRKREIDASHRITGGKGVGNSVIIK